MFDAFRALAARSAATGESPSLLRALARHLPMDEASRMQRAREMGFVTPLFHEAPGFSIEEMAGNGGGFDVGRHGAAGTDYVMPHGVFTKPTGESIGLGRGNEAQMPLWGRLGNNRAFANRAEYEAFLRSDPALSGRLDAVNAARADVRSRTDAAIAERDNNIPWDGPEDELNQYGEQTRAVLRQADADRQAIALDTARETRPLVTNYLRGQGIDSVTIQNDVGGYPWEPRRTPTTIILDPRNIRSRFAAFDPEERDSSDLLAQLLLTAGAGGGMFALRGAPDEHV